MDPVKLALAEEYQQRFPPDPEASTGNYEVLRTGRSHLVTELTDEMMVESVSDPEQLEMLRGLSFRSGLVVALKARGRVFGTVTWSAASRAGASTSRTSASARTWLVGRRWRSTTPCCTAS